MNDPRIPGSPFALAFFHDSILPSGINGRNLTQRCVFEFQVEQSDRESAFNAKNISLVTNKSLAYICIGITILSIFRFLLFSRAALIYMAALVIRLFFWIRV
jgi:hypothetical protein